jgi:hypothetical protein
MDHLLTGRFGQDTSVCIVDGTARSFEVKMATNLSLLAALKNPAYHFKRIGWKLDRCHNGCSVHWPKPIYRWSVKRGTCRRY